MKMYRIKLEMFNGDIINIKGKYTYDEASMLASAHLKDNLVKQVRLYVGRELRVTLFRDPIHN